MDRQIVLVTGSSGFIGTNITKYLLDNKYVVIALDIAQPRCIYPEYQYTNTGEALGTEADIWIVRGDIRDADLLRKLFDRRIRYIIHLAAVSTIQMGAEDDIRTRSINVGGTETLLNVAKEYGTVKGLLYASTDKVYGNLRIKAYTENNELNPLDSPYDRSKAEADKMVRKWCMEYGLHGVVFRFCNIYGRYDFQDTRIIPGTIKAALGGRESILRMYRDHGGNVKNFVREFLYVDDLCDFLVQVINRMELWNHTENARMAQWGEAFNLGAVQAYSMDEVIWKIQEIIGRKESPRVEIAETLVEIPEQRMNYAKARDCFGFAPETPLEEGLRETIRWWQEWMGESGNNSVQ